MIKIKNGIRYEKDGWIYLSIKGNPSQIGYAHGYLIAKELKEVFKMLEFNLYEEYGYKREMFSDIIGGIWGPIIEQNYPEYHEEMVGVMKGANAGGCKVSLNDMVLWNCLASMDSFFSIVPNIIKNYTELNKKYGHFFSDDSDDELSDGHSKNGFLRYGHFVRY